MSQPDGESRSHAGNPASIGGKSRGRFLGPFVQVVLGSAVAAAVLVAVAVPRLLSDPARLSRFVADAIPGLQADVSIGRARIGWSGPIMLEDVSIVPRNGSQPPLSIKRIEGSHGLLGVLLSGGDLGRLRVDGLQGDILFAADRTSNLTGLVAPVERSSRQASDGRGARRTPLRMRLDIDDAVVRISGPWAAEAWVSDPTDIRVALAPMADGTASAWTVDKVQLLREARLEPNVAQGVLAYIAPVMADAARTSGRFSLRLDGATFPVGAPEAARLAGVLSMHEVDMGPGPLVTKIFDSLPGRLELPRSIRVADDSEVEFHLARRRVWHKGLEFGIPLGKPDQRLDIHSSGSVGLDDRSLDLKFALPLPADLPADRPLLASLAGKSISIGVGGVLGEPKLNFDGSIRAAAGDVVTDLIDRLRNRGTPAPSRPATVPPPNWEPPQAPDKVTDEPRTPDSPQAAERNSSAAEIIDLVGGVLDEVARRRAERAAADANNPQSPPPGPRRGGRLLRRLAQPPDAAPAEAAPRQP